MELVHFVEVYVEEMQQSDSVETDIISNPIVLNILA